MTWLASIAFAVLLSLAVGLWWGQILHERRRKNMAAILPTPKPEPTPTPTPEPTPPEPTAPEPKG